MGDRAFDSIDSSVPFEAKDDSDGSDRKSFEKEGRKHENHGSDEGEHGSELRRPVVNRHVGDRRHAQAAVRSGPRQRYGGAMAGSMIGVL
ncbi:hypothetical protein Sjap_021483 [Stephania japonica]|uniref:Uncharacterized protein n=1 Tax=Stephania japonica TaxID=461633 RepID=A0AAP0HTI3_9MAGN